jgi:hypothetical protein
MELLDCKKAMEGFFQYEEEIINGLIVQVYYNIDDKPILMRDNKLYQLAYEFGGTPTGETGIFDASRRDIDFRFNDHDSASRFRGVLCSYNYFYHSKLNRNGKLENMPSIIEIQNYKEQFSRLNC